MLQNIKMGELSLNDKVFQLQQEIAKLPQWDGEKDTQHIFGGGMYARLAFRPAGVVVVGRVHKKEHLYMIMHGTVRVSTDDGPVDYTGPCMMVGKPGTKRAVLALTDATTVMIVKTDKTELDDELEKELVEEDETARYDVHNKIKPLEVENKTIFEFIARSK